MNETEFLSFEISKIVEKNRLYSRFSLFFPHSILEDHIPQQWYGERLNIKQIDGYGTFYFFTKRGKMQFHEYVLDMACDILKSHRIPFKRPSARRGADLRIGPYRIELETYSSARDFPQRRKNLLSKIKKYPETTILLFLNQDDKKVYLHTGLREIIIKNNRFLSLEEFSSRIEKLFL